MMRLAIVVLPILIWMSTFAAAEPSDGGSQVIRYTPDFFAAQNPKTALDMVQWIPGFTLSEGDATVRGFAGAAGNVVIDSDRSSDKQFTVSEILQRIAPDQVAYIEVIRGGAPGIDMLGQSVLANVVRRKDADDSAAITLADSQYANGHNLPSLTIEGTHHGEEGRRLTGAASVSRYLGLGTGTGPQTRTDAAGSMTGHDAINAASGGTTAYAYGVFETPFQAGQLRVNGNLAWTDFYRRTLDIPLQPAGAANLLREHLGGPLGAQLIGEIGASYKWQFGAFTSDTLMLLRLKGQSYSSQLTAPGQNQLFGEHDHSGEVVLRSQWQHGLGAASAEASLEGAYNWLGTSSLFSLDGFAVPLPNARAVVRETRGEAAAKLTWPFNPAWQLEGGLRLEYSHIAAQADNPQQKSLFYPKPRLLLTFTPDKASQFRLRIEREVGQLDFTNFVAASALDTGGVHSGNTDILPQDSWVFEAAYEYLFWNGASAGLTLRHSLIANAIDRVPVRDPIGLTATFDAPGNIGSGRLDAAELQLTLPLERLGLAQARLKGAGTLQWSGVTDPTTNVRREISDMRPLEYSVEFRQDLPDWNGAWGASLNSSCWGVTASDDCRRSEYRFNEVDNYRIGPALGLFAEYRPEPGLFLRMEADNLLPAPFDRDVRSFDGPRGIFQLAYTDDRRLRTSPFLHLNLRVGL